MITNLELVWLDQYTATIELEDNPVSRYMVSCVKHLQHLFLEFNHRDNPLADSAGTNHQAVILDFAKKLDINVDINQLTDQAYLNELHDQFLNSYSGTGNPNWLPLHDALHSIEDSAHQDRTSIWVDYKDRAGPLIKPFDRALLQYHTPTVEAGDCCVTASELGKTMWCYYRDREPNETSRICSVVPPWRYLKPMLDIFYRHEKDADRPYYTNPEFRSWVDSVSTAWAQHWGISDWSPVEISARLKVGRLLDIDIVQQKFRAGNVPVQLRLKQ
jgi:hypothetical protein